MKEKLSLYAAIVLLLVSCSNHKEPYKPDGLRKLTNKEYVDRARAREPVDVELVTFKNEQGEIIPLDSLNKISRTDFFGDQYVNKKGQLIEVVIRRATEEDKKLIAELQNVWNEGQEEELKEIEIREVKIECEDVDSLLLAIYTIDQEMRSPGNSLDQNTDFRNLEIVINLIEQCGIPTLKKVNQRAMDAVWLVFQHTIHNKYRKEYLPLLKQSAKNGDLNPGNIAMMEDRILMNDFQPQIYGTQVTRNGEDGDWELYELADPEYVDKRRAEVGLGPLKDYLRRWDIAFEVEQKR